MGPKSILMQNVKVDLGVMSLKGYSTLPRSPELEPHRHMPYNVITYSHLSILAGFTLLQWIQWVTVISNWKSGEKLDLMLS